MTKIHFPPKFNKAGNRQLWFYETGSENIDHFGNGLLTGLAVTLPIIAAVNML